MRPCLRGATVPDFAFYFLFLLRQHSPRSSSFGFHSPWFILGDIPVALSRRSVFAIRDEIMTSSSVMAHIEDAQYGMIRRPAFRRRWLVSRWYLDHEVCPLTQVPRLPVRRVLSEDRVKVPLGFGFVSDKELVGAGSAMHATSSVATRLKQRDEWIFAHWSALGWDRGANHHIIPYAIWEHSTVCYLA
jgi:hypothetical protein